MERYELIIRFFEEIGAAREAEMYLKLFQRGDPHRFAVVELAGDLNQMSLHMLALQCAFLASLDLYPVVLHGASSATSGRPARATRRIMDWLDGLTATRPEAKPADWLAAREATLAVSETLVSTVTLHEGEAAALVEGVFHRGRDGRVHAHTAPIATAIRRDQIPVVAALCADETDDNRHGASLPVRLRCATSALVATLRPRKIVRIRELGGIHRADGTHVDYINLRLHAEELFRPGVLDRAEAARLRECVALLESLPARSVVEFCAAPNLLRELFTQKGGGTLVKRGRTLSVHEGLAGISRSRLRALIERSFGRRLARDYFGRKASRQRPFRTVIVDPDYKGAAIVRDVAGLMYLDKFAVRPEARGEGIATDLWTILTENHASFFWRSRADNPINGWYFSQSTGCLKEGPWYVWWRNLDEGDVYRALKLAKEIPPTLAPAARP